MDYERIVAIAEQAGEIAKKYFLQNLTVTNKADNSPLTKADIEISNFIVSQLQRLDIVNKIISEENVLPIGKLDKSFWLIDPIDGTKAFIKSKNEYAINIAFIKDMQPEFGLIYQPQLERMIYTEGNQVFLKEDSQKTHILKSELVIDKLNLAASIDNSEQVKKQTLAFMKLNKDIIAEFYNVTSAVKFMMLAESKAHLYPRFGRTMEWDIAAGHAILKKLNGNIFSLKTKKEITYGKNNFANENFIAVSDESIFNRIKLKD